MLESCKTKLVLFDLDGTLIDTAPDFLISLNNVLAKHGKEKIGLAQIRPHISEGSSKMIKFFFQIDYGHKNFEMYKNEFLSEYKLNLIKNAKLFDGMDDVIEFLDNNSIMYGIVTNKLHEYAEPIVESFSELKNIKILICPDHVSVSKPDPEGIILACKKLNIKAAETIYLGDHLNDLKAGISAETRVIGCLYGYSLDQNIISTVGCPYVNSASEIISFID